MTMCLPVRTVERQRLRACPGRRHRRVLCPRRTARHKSMVITPTVRGYLPSGVLKVELRLNHETTGFCGLGDQPRASMQRAVNRSTLFL